MQLLVSVANAGEARSALDGGADIIDAKDPAHGALGPVSPPVLEAISAAVAGSRPFTAALGDAAGEAEVERAARTFARGGATLVKLGFGGIDDAARVEALLTAAVRGAHDAGGRVVAVAYADADEAASLPARSLLSVAVRAGAAGLLIDTAIKTGPGVRALVPAEALTTLVAEAHDAGLVVAVAGRLKAGDLAFVRDTGADIAGVRGAACTGGRTSPISSDKVRRLRALLAPTSPPGR